MQIENAVLMGIENGDIIEGQLEIPEGVSKIGRAAFVECTDIISITFPDSLKEIDFVAFYRCTGLTSLTFPEGLKKITESAFQHCTGLTSLTLPEGVKEIDHGVFYDCTGLTSLTLPEGVEKIGDHAFQECTGLTSVSLSARLKTIGKHAFRGCTGLTSLTLPEGIEEISTSSFDGCTNLNQIFVYSTDTTKVERIKSLLPEELQNKCIAHPLYEQIEGVRKHSLEKLCLEPKTSNIFSNRYKGILEQLPDLPLSEITQFLGEDSRYYREAEREMRGQSLPSTEKDLATYQITLDAIANQYMQLAREHKKYPHERKQSLSLAETKDDSLDGDANNIGGNCNIS